MRNSTPAELDEIKKAIRAVTTAIMHLGPKSQLTVLSHTLSSAAIAMELDKTSFLMGVAGSYDIVKKDMAN